MSKTDWIIVLGGLAIIAIIILVIGNGIYCEVRYWNTPWLEVPNHCHFTNR